MELDYQGFYRVEKDFLCHEAQQERGLELQNKSNINHTFRSVETQLWSYRCTRPELFHKAVAVKQTGNGCGKGEATRCGRGHAPMRAANGRPRLPVKSDVIGNLAGARPRPHHDCSATCGLTLKLSFFSFPWNENACGNHNVWTWPNATNHRRTLKPNFLQTDGKANDLTLLLHRVQRKHGRILGFKADMSENALYNQMLLNYKEWALNITAIPNPYAING